jgi:leader peptidase (prepilin peptidase) / N-methyltransferase
MMETLIALQLALLSGILAVVTVVDVRTQTIPDVATALLAAGGLLFAALDSVTTLQWAAASGLVYFLLFWGIRGAHWRLTGRLGLGFGDVKLAAAAGLWLTPALLPFFMGAAAGSALLAIGVFAVFAGAGALSRRIPFGPFLAVGLLACWLVKVSNPPGGTFGWG